MCLKLGLWLAYVLIGQTQELCFDHLVNQTRKYVMGKMHVEATYNHESTAEK